jgi:hypothetical protein
MWESEIYAMNIGLKTFTLGAALACAAIISCPAKAITFSNLVADLVADQEDEAKLRAERDPNYTVNHCLNLGNRDGYRQHSEHHNKCLHEEACQCYALGYRQGFNVQRSYRMDHQLSSWARVRTTS